MSFTPNGSDGPGTPGGKGALNERHKSRSTHPIADLTKRFKNIRGSSKSKLTDTPTRGHSKSSLRPAADRSSIASESSATSSVKHDEDPSIMLDDPAESESEVEEDDADDDKILRFEADSNHLMFKVDETREKLANLEKKLGSGAYDERKYNKKRLKYEAQIASAEAKIAEIDKSCNAYKAQKHGKKLSVRGNNSSNLVQGVLNKMGKPKRIGSDRESNRESTQFSSSTLPSREATGTVGAHGTSRKSATSVLAAQAARATSVKTGSQSSLEPSSISGMGSNQSKSEKREVPSNTSSKLSDLDEDSRSIGGSGSAAGSVVEGGGTWGGSDGDNLSVGGTSIGSGLLDPMNGAHAAAIAGQNIDPDVFAKKGAMLRRLKQVMEMDTDGDQTSSAPSSGRKDKKTYWGKSHRPNRTPVQRTTGNEIIFAQVNSLLEKLMQETLNLTVVANDHQTKREQALSSIKEMQLQLKEQREVVEDQEKVIDGYNRFIAEKVDEQAGELALRLNAYELSLRHEVKSIENAIEKCEDLESKILAGDETMQKHIHTVQAMHDDYQKRPSAIETFFQWFLGTSLTNKTAVCLALITFGGLIIKWLLGVSRVTGGTLDMSKVDQICDERIQKLMSA